MKHQLWSGLLLRGVKWVIAGKDRPNPLVLKGVMRGNDFGNYVTSSVFAPYGENQIWENSDGGET